MAADIILHHAKIATNGVPAFVEAVAIEWREESLPRLAMTKFCRHAATGHA